jgi:hypothetical protein
MTVENFSAAHWIKDFGAVPVNQFTAEFLRTRKTQDFTWENYFAV